MDFQRFSLLVESKNMFMSPAKERGVILLFIISSGKPLAEEFLCQQEKH
jgi:hypothetical protein